MAPAGRDSAIRKRIRARLRAPPARSPWVPTTKSGPEPEFPFAPRVVIRVSATGEILMTAALPVNGKTSNANSGRDRPRQNAGVLKGAFFTIFVFGRLTSAPPEDYSGDGAQR